MTDFLKTRLYIHIHSRYAKVFLAFSAVWCIGFLLTMLGVGPDKRPISSAYGLWRFMDFYFSVLPVAVAYWYSDLISNRFADNIPFGSDHKLSISGLLFALLMNLVSAGGFLLYGNIMFLIPNKAVVYHNDPFTMFTLSMVYLAASFVRCILVVFLIELIKSRLWGAIFGIMCSSGLSYELILSLETMFLIATGAGSSSFPLAHSTAYMMVVTLMPGRDASDQWVVRELQVDIPVLLLRMFLYFTVAAILILILIRRRDRK